MNDKTELMLWSMWSMFWLVLMVVSVLYNSAALSALGGIYFVAGLHYVDKYHNKIK